MPDLKYTLVVKINSQAYSDQAMDWEVYAAPPGMHGEWQAIHSMYIWYSHWSGVVSL